MNFPSIDIQGSIISTDLLGKIRTEQANYQKGKDFNKELTDAKLKDEISFAWQDAKGQWSIFQNKLSRLKEGETGTTETRNFWIVPLLTNLGYNLSFGRQSEELNGKTFPIAYRDSQLDGFPVYIGGFHESLDKRPENKLLRVSPHAMVQEYLNYSEHLNGLVTNGKQIRLLRDASRITRLSYVEFNLQKIMEEDLYSDFVLLYRLLHASRMPQKIDSGAESIIEKYHQEGLEAGSTIRNKLGTAVKESIKALANGFINHPDNEILREALQHGNLNTDEYYRQQLRIIYRLLFLFVIEERNLVYAESKTPETKRFNQIYFDYYSLLRLRKLAKKLPQPDANRHYDLWQSLLSTFALFEKKEMGGKLGIMSLQGDLFGSGSLDTSYYDLHDCRLSNALVLRTIKALSYFENQSNVLIAVNYGGLDVEEFGSVYEGLLELKLNIELIVGTNNYSCSFAGSEERSKSGSHYTPDELVQPLIKHSLDYLLDDRKKIISDIIDKRRLIGPDFRTQRQELVKQHVFSLKVCDVACGSGHLLISGARRIAEVAACIIEEEEQPNPKAFQLAKRNAILNCIYGVDKNPLAVELCKVALWLEAYVPGQPLNFLDHHIKCGDAIVGLAHRKELENGISDEAFKTMPCDDMGIAKIFRDQNNIQRKEREANAIQLQAEFEKTTENSVQEAIAEYKTFNKLSESTPEEIERKAIAYQKFMNCKGYGFLKIMADTQLAQFFIPKIEANKEYLMTDGDFRQIMKGYKGWQDRKTAKSCVIAFENRFFHWFLEFPEVFQKDGFDCALGNPPFLGGKKISGLYGVDYLNYIKTVYEPSNGGLDYVVYFFRRIFEIIKPNGFQSLISTKTIYQGDSRIGGLEYILNNGGSINYAIRSMTWPGSAAVEICLITINKNNRSAINFLNNKSVEFITSRIDSDSDSSLNPEILSTNLLKSFIGSIVNGLGFIIEKNEVQNFEQLVVFPYLSGDDINNSIHQKASRFIINFKDLDENYCLNNFPIAFERIKKTVKPQRQLLNRASYKKLWWQYAEKCSDLYRQIAKYENILVIPRVSKYVNVAIVNKEQVFMDKVVVLALDAKKYFGLIQNSIFDIWSWKYSSTLGSSTINFRPTEAFQTFPFPQKLSYIKEQQIESIGKSYDEYRAMFMINTKLGITKTYNAFHAKELKASLTSAFLEGMDKMAIENQYTKEVWYLWNHLQKNEGVYTIDEAIIRITKLRELHVQLDNRVLEAYGWQDIQLIHDFYEVDYLPENDRIRYTIHPDARKEILKRLLELNHKIHEEEVKMGLWGKKKTSLKVKSKKNEVNEPQVGYGNFFNQK
jgi:hypothetical protein